MDNLESVSLKGAAEALHRSERTVRRYLREGRLTAERVSMRAGGWQYQIPRALVDSLAEELQGGTPGGAPGGRGVKAEGAAPVGHDWPARLATLEAENAALREERDFLRRVLENTTRALPPATAEPPPAPEPWWRKLLGRGER